MKHTTLLITLLACMPFLAFAQTENGNKIAAGNDEKGTIIDSKPVEIVTNVDNKVAEQVSDEVIGTTAKEMAYKASEQAVINAMDSSFHYRPMDPINYDYWMYPWLSYRAMGYLGGMPYWNMHEGLNVTLGASVFGEFGKGARRGAGFAEQLALVYAHHFSLKGGDVIYRDGGRKGFTFVGGAYFNNIDYAHMNSKDFGVYGELSYRFDEHWEAAIYGQKSFMDKNRMMPPSLYDMERLGDRIGASVRYNFSPSFSMQLSVETSTRPGPPVPNSPFDNNNNGSMFGDGK